MDSSPYPHQNKSWLLCWLGITALLLFIPRTTSAATIVHWDGTANDQYTSGAYNGQVTETNNTDYRQVSRTFSMATALNPGAGNVQPSERFYGGIFHRIDGELNLSTNLNSRINNITGGSRSENRMQSNQTTDPAIGVVRVAFLWKSDDFTNGGQPAGLLEDSTLALNVTAFVNGQLRFAVQVEDEFYLSLTTFTGISKHVLTITDTTQWYEWDPTQNNMEFSTTGLDPVTLDLSGVQSVGFMYQANINGQGGSTSRQGSIFWNEFEVVAIPEPHAALLLAIGVSLLLIRRKRRVSA